MNAATASQRSGSRSPLGAHSHSPTKTSNISHHRLSPVVNYQQHSQHPQHSTQHPTQHPQHPQHGGSYYQQHQSHQSHQQAQQRQTLANGSQSADQYRHHSTYHHQHTMYSNTSPRSPLATSTQPPSNKSNWGSAARQYHSTHSNATTHSLQQSQMRGAPKMNRGARGSQSFNAYSHRMQNQSRSQNQLLNHSQNQYQRQQPQRPQHGQHQNQNQNQVQNQKHQSPPQSQSEQITEHQLRAMYNQYIEYYQKFSEQQRRKGMPVPQQKQILSPRQQMQQIQMQQQQQQQQQYRNQLQNGQNKMNYQHRNGYTKGTKATNSANTTSNKSNTKSTIKHGQNEGNIPRTTSNASNSLSSANNSNASNSPKVAIPSNMDKESYVQMLLQKLKEQSAEMNKMQSRICELEKAVGSKHILEEDFRSFVSRIEFPSTVTEEQRKLCLNKLFELETHKLRTELEAAQRRRTRARALNLALETEVIEITDDISAMKDALEEEKHRNYLESVNYNKNLAAKLARNRRGYVLMNDQRNASNDVRGGGGGAGNGRVQPPRRAMDYPPENIIIQTLIRTQIEFYFSDYNLKRDKRLLDQLCSDRIGFLKIDSVMNLTRVRQLLSHRNQVINSLKSSKFLTLTHDREWVGRLNFQRPQEKQFPFRRTVFVFGLPMDCDEKYVSTMLSPFGKLSAVTFDHGPDTLDRLVAEAMFDEARVYRYRDMSTGNKCWYHYKQEIMVGGSHEYKCTKCGKTKQCDEGFYETNSYQTLICLQCTAASAEANLEKAKGESRKMLERMCGRPPRDTKLTKTCLAVFTSQRQASKCVYVRSRIAYEGCFATHYHHYSKCKKEIALSMQPKRNKLKQIPPLREPDLRTDLKRKECPQRPMTLKPPVRSIRGTHPMSPPVLHNPLSSTSKRGDDEKEEMNENNLLDPSQQIPSAVRLTSAESRESECTSRDDNISVTPMALSDEEIGGASSSRSMPKPIMSMIRTVPVFCSNENENVENNEDDDEKKNGNDGVDAVPKLMAPSEVSKISSVPKLKKKNEGSITAPVKGGTGSFYLTKAAYNRMTPKAPYQIPERQYLGRGKARKHGNTDD